MKLGPMTMEEGRCYLDMAGGSVERALWEFKADKAWEKDHPPPISAKGKPLAIRGMST